MNFLRSMFFAVFLFWFAATPQSRAAIHSPIDDLSKNLSRQIAQNKTRTIVVADITRADGSPCSEGLYFADLLSAYLAQPGTRLKVVSRQVLQHVLAAHSMILSGETPADAVQKIGAAVHAQAIVFGKFEKAGTRITVTVFAEQTSDGQNIGGANASLDDSKFFDSLASYPQAAMPNGISRVGADTISAPECIDCPAPQLKSRADADSKVLLLLAVSAEGRVVAVKVIRGAGVEFADEALQFLRVFRYKPAQDRGGRPIAAGVFLEILFVKE